MHSVGIDEVIRAEFYTETSILGFGGRDPQILRRMGRARRLHEILLL